MASKRSAFSQTASGRTIEIPNAPPRRTPDGADPELSSATGNKLIVGRSIQLRGEIAACDVLVVEGQVEASMASRVIEIAEGGVFKGTAEVETAEIRGRFEGNLTASKVLRIYATGEVRGRVRYGSLEVATGGEIAGDVGTVGAPERTSAPIKVTAGATAAGTAPDTADLQISADQTAGGRQDQTAARAAPGKT